MLGDAVGGGFVGEGGFVGDGDGLGGGGVGGRRRWEMGGGGVFAAVVRRHGWGLEGTFTGDF